MRAEIVEAVCNLLLDEKKRTAASQQAKAAMDPAATLRIAGEIVQLMISRSRDSNNQASTHRFQGARKKQGEITRETPGSYTKKKHRRYLLPVGLL